jgi:hypothetical protein
VTVPNSTISLLLSHDLIVSGVIVSTLDIFLLVSTTLHSQMHFLTHSSWYVFPCLDTVSVSAF